jgi:predicted ATPase
MKIHELKVKGFRSLKDAIWTPGNLNVIIGPNGTGKSNLLRLFEMISAGAQGQLNKFVQSAGGMDPLVWDGQATDIEVRIKTSPSWHYVHRHSLTYELTLARLGQSGNYQIEHEVLGNTDWDDVGRKPEPFKLFARRGSSAQLFDDDAKAVTAPAEGVPEGETLVFQAGGPFAFNRSISLFQANLALWSVYHALNVNYDSPVRLPAIARLDKRVVPDGQNLVTVLHTLYTGDRDFKQNVNSAMRAAFGDEFEELVFPPASDQRIQLRVRWKSLRREQSAADLSDGTLRFLFLIAVLASPAAAPLIAIDEPETGLHPSMLPIIADYAVDAAKRSQVILTTHSPAMLDAFRETPPTTTVATWEHGQTGLKIVAGDVLEGWLKNYSLGKLFTSGELEQLAAG